MDRYNFLELAKERYSVRKFKEKPIGKEELDLILEAGRIAPTAANKQPQKILVINEKESLDKIKLATKYHFNSSLAILICYDEDICWKRDYDGSDSGEIDTSIITTHMMLEAASLGIGSTWVMNFDPEIIREEFSIPEEIVPVALLVMGYPSEESKPSPRHTEFKDVEETIFYNNF